MEIVFIKAVGINGSKRKVGLAHFSFGKTKSKNYQIIIDLDK